jgi:hypothetical protein
VLPRFLPLLPPVLLRLWLDRLLLLVAISTPHLFPELVGEEAAPGAESQHSFERSLPRCSEPASGPVVAAAEGEGSSAGGGMGKPLPEFERLAQCALASAQSSRQTH